MKVTTSEIEGSQVVLEMEIEPERVEKAMDRAYRRLVSRMNVPGFRRGKAPRVLVERMVGRDTLMNDALEILVPEVYQEAVRETGIEPVDTPKLDVVGAEPLSVRATVPVRPKLELGDYRAIRQSLEVPEVSEDQVANALESLRESRASWVPVTREAREGDMLTLDLRGRAEQETFVEERGLHLVLDPSQVILAPGLVEELVGMMHGGSKSIEVTLPEDFAKRELAGKGAAIEVTVSEVKEKQVPELDDDLARSLGEYSSLEELRAAARKELEEQVRDQARRNLEETVLAAVIDQAKVDLPLNWVQEQAELLRKNAQERAAQQGLTFEQFLQLSNRTEDGFREETLSAARRQVKRMLVLGAVADAEGITVGDEEVEATLAQGTKQGGERMEAATREGVKAQLRSLLRERRTAARLVEIATGAEEGEEREEAAAAPEISTTEQSQTEEEA